MTSLGGGTSSRMVFPQDALAIALFLRVNRSRNCPLPRATRKFSMATESSLRRPTSRLIAVAGLLLAAPLWGAEAKKVNDQVKEIAGTSEFLRSVPKHFATLKAVDSARHRVTLLIDGEKLPKVWPLTPDAEIKVTGWWGRLE